MRQISYLLFPLLTATAVTLAWGCGDDGGGSGGAGGEQIPCDKDADCEDSNPCTFEFCISGVCDFQAADQGPVPGQEQTDGDCKSINCVGTEILEENVQDPPEDNDGSDCIVPNCDDGTATTAFRDVGSGCDSGNGDGICDDMGVCSCAVAPGGQAFVDPVNGQDIPTNGGDNGACAYATLEYAVSQHDGEIRLPVADFTVTEALVMTGNQFINCSFDQDNNQRTNISGSGPYGMGTATIVFNGTINRIDNCGIDGQGATSAIYIASDGMGQPHNIDDSIISNAVDGITMAGNNVDITDSVIQNHTIGVNITTLDARVFFDGNQFSGNGTDITCADASPQVSGQNNNNPSCMTCMSCGGGFDQ